MIERRVFPVEGIEFREAADGKLQFRGHAAVFDSDSEPIGGMFVERIAPGAFSRTLKQADVRFLVNHDPNLVLARSKRGQGTLSLTEDRKGLVAEAEMAPTSYAKDLSISMQRGDIDQMSFGFSKVRDSWDRSNPDMPVRTLQEVRLFDVSAVTFPAYNATTASVRNELRQIMASAGLSAPEHDFSDIDLDLAVAFLASGEQRVGKAISAANADKIRAAIEALETLLGMDDMKETNALTLGDKPGLPCPYCAVPLMENEAGEAYCFEHGVNPSVNQADKQQFNALQVELEARKRRLRLLETITAA